MQVRNVLSRSKLTFAQSAFFGDDKYRVYSNTKKGLTWPQAVKFCEEIGQEWSLAAFTIFDYFKSDLVKMFNHPCATQSRYWIRQYNNFTVRARGGRPRLTKFNVECPVWSSQSRKHRIAYEVCRKRGYGVICSTSKPRTVGHRVRTLTGKRTTWLEDMSNTECDPSGTKCFCKGGFSFGFNDKGQESCIDINECMIGLSDCLEDRGETYVQIF